MGCSSKEQTGEREGIIYNPLSFVEHLYSFLVLILGFFVTELRSSADTFQRRYASLVLEV